MRSRASRLLLAFAVAGLVGGCKQGVGERCQLDSDCASGHCAVAAGMLGVGGTCSPSDFTPQPDMAVTTPADLTSSGDLTPSADLTPSPDLTPVPDASTD